MFVCLFVCVLLAQLSVDGEHFRVTNKGECQDGDGVRSLRKRQEQLLLEQNSLDRTLDGVLEGSWCPVELQ